MLVLKALSLGPLHGYGIGLRIRQLSDDVLRVEEGSLYPALHRMEHLGWITAAWQTTANNRRARLYTLTRAGQKRLDEEQVKWDRLTKGVGKILRFA
jgi:transcriptional regulator